MLTVFVIGDVLGAGIYALVGEVAGKVGGAVWTSFLAAGILAAFTATAYAELVTKYPQAAGAALYAHKAYRRPFLTFLIAFAVMCSGVASAAAARGRAARADRHEHEGLLGDRAVRARQRRADQHDHGLAADLRHGPAGHRAAGDGPRARRAPHAVAGDHLCLRGRADRPRRDP